MSQTNPEAILTQHAMLVVWGQYARLLGLIQELQAVPLHQKKRVHDPQTKIIEFLVAILGGLPYLKDISQAAHPLDQDQPVAQAWQQPAWADYSGVSRTLQELTMPEAIQIVQVLEAISQPFIDHEVTLALQGQKRIVYDGDLTGRPVSNSSTTYPNVAYGHMSDKLQLGYQAAMVSMRSPTYGRLWLSVTPHPGDTVSCTQAEGMIVAAEARTGVRPRRRTDQLQQRIQDVVTTRQGMEARLQHGQTVLARAQDRLQETSQQVQAEQGIVALCEADYQKRQRLERPHSRLAQARVRLATYQQRQIRRERAVSKAQGQVKRQTAKVVQWQAAERFLRERLTRFEQENATNTDPIQAVFRLDAGFGTHENVALLIEMGYEVYTKPYSHRVATGLRLQVTAETPWTRVGANAEMVAWSAVRVAKYPYPLDVALERFHTGDTLRHSALLHYGNDPVTADLPAWFHVYNSRQTIEAGIKEGKGVFQMHHLKVRAVAALFLQEQFAAFAANFVRWAAHWLATRCRQSPENEQKSQPGVKELVQVAAHTSAWVVWQPDGCLLKFTDQSVYAGRSLTLPESCLFAPF